MRPQQETCFMYLLMPRILSWRLKFWKICTSLSYRMNLISDHTTPHTLKLKSNLYNATQNDSTQKKKMTNRTTQNSTKDTNIVFLWKHCLNRNMYHKTKQRKVHRENKYSKTINYFYMSTFLRTVTKLDHEMSQFQTKAIVEENFSYKNSYDCKLCLSFIGLRFQDNK